MGSLRMLYEQYKGTSMENAKGSDVWDTFTYRGGNEGGGFCVWNSVVSSFSTSQNHFKRPVFLSISSKLGVSSSAPPNVVIFIGQIPQIHIFNEAQHSFWWMFCCRGLW